MGAILALTSQALQQDCRQISTGLLRIVSVLAMFFVMLVMYSQPTRASGLTFASWLLWLNYVGITLGAFSWFSSAIAEEREQRTLGLLRMTGVHSVAILLGKWLPRLVVLHVLIIVQIPLAVLSVTMGGVTRYQLLAGYIALMAYAIMLSGVGLLWSVVCSHSRRAASLTLWFWLMHVPGVALLKLFFIPGAPLYQFIPKWTGLIPPLWMGDLVSRLHNMSLFKRLDNILATGFGEPLFELQVVSNVLVGLGAFAIAWFVFEFVTLYNLETPPKTRINLLSKFRSKREQKTGKRPASVGRTWSLAIAWKEFFFSCGGWKWLFTKMVFYHGLALGIIGIAASAGMSFRDAWNEIAAGVFFWCGFAGLLVESAGLTGRMFQAEIKGNTLTELMMLPVGVGRIAYEKILGICVGLIPALTAIILASFIDIQQVADFVSSLFSFNGLVGFCCYLSFLHLSVWLSIHIRTGGLVLAFLFFWVGSVAVQLLLMVVLGFSNDEAWLRTIVILISLLFCAAAQYRIVVDLQRKGAG